MARPDFYEETVVTYMETKGVDRLEAHAALEAPETTLVYGGVSQGGAHLLGRGR